MNGEQLVAVHRNHSGEILSFQTSGGRIISYRKALQEAEEGLIAGIHIAEEENGTMSMTPAASSSFDEFPSFY
ncbi:DUF3892 domain-containing protein [Bacillus sp. ISL-47]|uniref:DUF3892 domain-containing protein n=1 Tax=Bacillus sp. ISL-47 TaxID=2819130 RepID=UPI001BE74470|nr:DUF3892 domain-containing protein [Bacillus sp. ISL-47]MBT2689153.1 DUF3892 domain-containing protein [Bacillus sp. ISL-47]MBT2708939.1 DUF3892 domain-containing protein [Pseudomonas sp. ISL-84]